MIVALKSGKCNLIVTDIPTAKAAAFANPDLTMVTFPEDKGFKTSKEDVEIGIAIKKGNKELADAMNKVLSGMTELTSIRLWMKLLRNSLWQNKLYKNGIAALQ